jgi:ATP-dependent DNA ligase
MTLHQQTERLVRAVVRDMGEELSQDDVLEIAEEVHADIRLQVKKALHRPRRPSFAKGLRRLAQRLPILWEGTVLDAELIAGRFAGTMAALQGSARHGDALRVHVFDVPMLAGVDLRRLPWDERRERLELLAQAFEPPYELVPLVEPAPSLAEDMAAGIIEGIVLKDRRSTYRDGSRAGWSKVKDRSRYERESWRFDRR